MVFHGSPADRIEGFTCSSGNWGGGSFVSGVYELPPVNTHPPTPHAAARRGQLPLFRSNRMRLPCHALTAALLTSTSLEKGRLNGSPAEWGSIPHMAAD